MTLQQQHCEACRADAPRITEHEKTAWMLCGTLG